MADTTTRLGITVLGSGSRGNAIVVHTENEALLIDAGFSARELRARMRQAEIDPSLITAILVTHEHADHVKGLRVFSSQFGLPVYANRATADILRRRDTKLGAMTLFAAGTRFRVGNFAVEPFSIPHDANDPVAFVLRFQSSKIGIATDLGHANSLVTYQLRGCHALVLESNHDPTMLGNSKRPWSLKQRIMSRHGHLSNASCRDLLRDVLDEETRHVVLAHASQDCNCYDLVREETRTCLHDMGRPDIGLHVAIQDKPLPTLWL